MDFKAKLLKKTFFPLVVFVIISCSIFITKKNIDIMVTSPNELALSKEPQIDNSSANLDFLLNSSSTWSDPLRITDDEIRREEYTTLEDKSGIYHCVWIGKITSYGQALFHTYLENDAKQLWSEKKLVARIDAEVSDLNLIIDENNTLHLFFVAARENIFRIYYTSKANNSINWNPLKILTTNYNEEISDLKTSISMDKIIHLVWINKPIRTMEGNFTFFYANYQDEILNSQILKKTENKILGSIQQRNDTAIQIIYSIQIDEENIQLIESVTNNSGLSWISKELDQFDIKLEDLQTLIVPNKNETHILGASKTNQLYYMKLLLNGTINFGPSLIGNPSGDIFYGGIIENNSSDFYLFYEERINTRSDIYYALWNNTDNNWEVPIKITNSLNSINPIAIQNRVNNQSLGLITFLDTNSLNFFIINKSEDLSSINLIQKTTYFNYSPSMVVDSNGTMHLLWTQTIQGTHEVFYEKKEIGKNWKFISSLTINNWSTATFPSLFIDENDTIHCVFVANYKGTNYDALYYTYLVPGLNWSNPVAVKIPEDDAYKTQAQIFLDDNANIHIFWTEKSDFSTNNIIYSTKKITDEFFSSIVIYENELGVSAFDLSATIDPNNNIHVVFASIIGEPFASKIQYVYQFSNKTWSPALIIDASSNDYFDNPIIDTTTTGTLSLVYLRKYVIAPQKIAADIRYKIKRIGENWVGKSDIITYELIGSMSYCILPNDTECITYYSKYLTIDTPGPIDDHYFFLYKEKNNDWNKKELLYLNPNYGARPVEVFNPVTNSMHFILIDKKTNQPQLNWLTAQKDSDNDLLGDIDEEIYQTNPLLGDSDLDGLIDGLEVKSTFTDPKLNDTDWDKLIDGLEVLVHFCDPKKKDSDFDQVLDGDEVLIYGTNPNFIDTDYDGLYDYLEIFIYHTDPNSNDTDGDTMPDLWEILNLLNPLVDDGFDDADDDNLLNKDEYRYSTDPNNWDTDGDNLSDGIELLTYKTNPNEADTDFDTLNDDEEILIYKTNPLKADSDSDGFTDREEINSGTDPNNPRDNIYLRRLKRILGFSLTPIAIIVLLSIYLELRYRRKRKEQEKSEKILLENSN